MRGRRERRAGIAVLVATAALAAAAGASAGAGRTGVEIAVVDSGVARIAPLVAALRPGRDLVDGRSTLDGNGHGTAMASIATGSGLCRSCAIVPVRVTGNGGLGTTALAAAGIRWAVAAGARVVNVSLTTAANDPAFNAAIADAVAHGVVVVLPAGNRGSSDPAHDGYPAAAAPEAIVVAGVDGQGGLYPWSNHGGWVDVAAPGKVTARNAAGKSFLAEGTSASTAYVAGVVGLMLNAAPQLTPAQVENILTRTARPVAGLDVASGGVVDPRAAVAAATA